jgi:lysophospholipase L1-like esterase
LEQRLPFASYRLNHYHLFIDNVEDGNAGNPLGGAWSTYAAAPSTVGAPSYSGPGYPSSPYGALHAVSMTGSNSGSQVGSLSTSFAPALDMGAKDRLVFWIKATGASTSFHVNVARAAITDYDHYGANFTVTLGSWTRVEIPLSTMAQGGWGAAKPMAWNDVNGLTFYTAATGAYSIQLDDLSFECPGPPPTATVTRTASPTRTVSPTATPSPTSPPVGSSPTQTPSSLLTPCAPDNFGSFLQSGDKILFLGDSITYRGNFTKMVQQHLTQRFPAAGFTFVNQGGPGDAGLQVWNRRAAVVAANPDVVLLCLGMNDAYSIANYQTDYPNYMTQIITYLQGNGIRVALLTPGITDLSLPFIALDAGYNTRLRWEADWVLNYAATNSIPVYDINAAMAAADAALKGALSGACMIPDGVHPDPAGGWVMGLGALKALGVPDRCGEILYDGPSSYTEASGPMLASPSGPTAFDLQLNTLPPVAPAAARKVLPYTPLQAQVNHLRLRATNLPGASYYIVIDGHRAGPVSAVALAAGINLYDYWTAPAASASEWHHIELLNASGQPAYVCDSGASDGLIDDFETAPLGQWLVNGWGGDSWGLDPGTGTSTVSPLPAALAYSSPGYGGSGSCLRISGTADLGPGNPPVLLAYMNGLNSDVKQGVRFWIKGSAGKSVRFQIHTWYEKRQVPEYWNDFGYTFTTTGAWQQVSVPYSSLTLPGWGTAYTFDPQEIYNLDWLPFTAGAYDISIDNIEFYCTTVTTYAGGYTPRPTPPPAAPKRECSTCQAGHRDLNSAAHCAAAHAARGVVYAWVDAQPDPPDLDETKLLLGRLTNRFGQPRAIAALEVVIDLGWRPVELDDDGGE